MTIANQLASCLASIEGAAADLKTFALQTKDQQAKQMFQQLSQTMDHSVQQLKGRLDYIMQEEPQYRNEIQGTYNMSSWTQGGGAQIGQGTGGFGTTTGTGGTTMGGTTMGGMTGGSTGSGMGTFGNSTMMTSPTQGSGITTTTTTTSSTQKTGGNKQKQNRNDNSY